MVRIPGTEKLSLLKEGEDDEKDDDGDEDHGDDDGIKLGTMDMPQVSAGTACKELHGGKQELSHL